ncbi:hypothetical protein LCGC14_0540030 [marine sediment metagenome]|uniref:Uncharacterized protein n=1 Tax=marine sediment metagenome TaxID=412755 RepID=A0A0F9UED8_9ZZZZ
MKMTKELQENDISPNEFAETLIEITELVNKLNNESNDEDVRCILRLLPENSRTFRNASFNTIRQNTPLPINEIREMYNEEHPPPEVENDATGRILSINEELDKLRKQYRNYDYLKYDNKIIKITDSEIYLKFRSKPDSNKWYSVVISKFNLKIISKCIDKDDNTYYTFTANKSIYRNYSIMEFLKKREGAIVKKTAGLEVIKHIFGEKGKNVPSKKAKQTFGFKNGWWVSFEDK